METTSDHLDHQVLLKNEYGRICEVYMPDGVLKSQLNHQLHSEHGNDVRIKIADITSFYPSGKPLDMCFSEKILPVFDVNGEVFIGVGYFYKVQKYMSKISMTSPSPAVVYASKTPSFRAWSTTERIVVIGRSFSSLSVLPLVYSDVLGISEGDYIPVYRDIQAAYY